MILTTISCLRTIRRRRRNDDDADEDDDDVDDDAEEEARQDKCQQNSWMVGSRF